MVGGVIEEGYLVGSFVICNELRKDANSLFLMSVHNMS